MQACSRLLSCGWLQNWRWQDSKRQKVQPSLGRPGVVKDERKTVYVRNLPFAATEDDIVSFFSACGGVADVRRGITDGERPAGACPGFPIPCLPCGRSSCSPERPQRPCRWGCLWDWDQEKPARTGFAVRRSMLGVLLWAEGMHSLRPSGGVQAAWAGALCSLTPWRRPSGPPS